jgi:hypothetical protein
MSVILEDNGHKTGGDCSNKLDRFVRKAEAVGININLSVASQFRTLTSIGI